MSRRTIALILLFVTLWQGPMAAYAATYAAACPAMGLSHATQPCGNPAQKLVDNPAQDCCSHGSPAGCGVLCAASVGPVVLTTALQSAPMSVDIGAIAPVPAASFTDLTPDRSLRPPIT